MAGTVPSIGIAALFGGGVTAGAPAGMSGSGGIFTQLLSGAAAAVPGVAQNGSGMAPNGSADGASVARNGALPVTLPLLNGDGEESGLAVTATQTDIQVLVARIEVVAQTLSAAGVDMQAAIDAMAKGDGKEQLAAALQVLGMSPEEAAVMAEKIEKALEMAKTQLKMNAEDLAQMAGLMLAATPSPVLAEVTGDAGFSVTVEVTTVQLSVMQATVTMQQNGKAVAAGQTAARGVVGLDVPVSGEGTKDLAAALTDEDARQADYKLTLTDEGFAVTDGEDAMLVTTMPAPAVAAVPTPQVVTQTMSEAVPVAAMAEKIAGKIESGAVERVIEKPRGEVMYQWKASETGVEQVTATPAVHKAMESLIGPHGAAVQAELAGEIVAETPLGGFADRLASAMRHSVTQQASVQMQSLGEQGGGTVRMMLNPPELGQITIEMTIKDGVVHGAIEATDGAVVELLAKEVGQLRHGLAEAGLKVSQDGISLMLNNQGHNPQQQAGNPFAQQADNGGRGSFGGAGADEVGAVDAESVLSNPAAWVSPDRLVDVSV